MNNPLTTSNPQSVAPAGNPFRHRAFTVIWIATVVSNIGGWMYSIASGWLMTSLDPNAFIVSMVTRRWKLQTGANVDFSPSMHWPDPVTTHTIEPDRGPVLVTVEYRIDPKNRKAFLHAIGQNSRERRRDGAYDWGIFEDPADDGRFIETFLTDSWLEHLRQHRRVTKGDRISEQAVRRFQIGDGPKTTHLISAQRE